MGLTNMEYCGKRYWLQKTAVSKWKMMQAGLSDEGKQKLDNYRASSQEELNSIAQGNDNIAKRLGYSVVESFLPNGITDKQILEAVNRNDKDILGFLLALYGGGAATHSRRSNIGYDKNYIIKDLTKDRYKILERAANTLPDKTIYYIPSVNLKNRYKYDGIDPLWYKFQDELNKRHEMFEAISQENQ